MDNSSETAKSIEELEHLKKLHDEKTLSDDEFTAAKAKILGIANEAHSESNAEITSAQKKARMNFAIAIGFVALMLILVEINTNHDSTSPNPDLDRMLNSISESQSATNANTSSPTTATEANSSTSEKENPQSLRFDKELEEWKTLRNTSSNNSRHNISNWHLKCRYVSAIEEAHCSIFNPDNELISSLAAGLNKGDVVLKNQTHKIHEGDILIVSGRFGGVTDDGEVVIYVTQIVNEGVK